MSLEKNFFRQVMGHFATGVTVVTTSSKGVLGGLTVNAFCSVSLTPPLVLISVDLTSNTLPLIRESGIFAVNMLTAQQEEFSRCFATYSPERLEHFCHASYSTAATGAPILDNVLAFVDARVVAEYPGGDHVLFLGQVEALGAGGKSSFAHDLDKVEAVENAQQNGAYTREAAPLLYYQGQYRHMAEQYRAPSLPDLATTASPKKQPETPLDHSELSSPS